MKNALLRYLVLPSEVSEFEDQYLTKMNRVGLWFFVLHLPIFVLLAAVNDTGPVLAALLTSAVLAGPVIACRMLKSKRMISSVMGATAMIMGGLLVHFGQGPVQIEMHFYFFVLIALLAVYANPMVVVVAAVTAAAHHAALWFLLPASVFNYDAPLWVVAVHALFVVLESVAACFIARSFFDNVVQLEKKVAQRTKELESRNNDMRMLLNAVNQGFLTIDSNGTMSDERSLAVDQWLGTPESGMTLFDYMRSHDEKFATWLEMGVDDAFNSIMPVEVTLDQMPKRVVVEGRIMSFDYAPVKVDGEMTALAIVISDITADVQREILETENREMMAMITRISEDKQGFLEFFREADTLVDALRSESFEDLDLVKRQVHTLKGNCGIFELFRVADACHVIEDHMAETGTLPEPHAWTTLFDHWDSTCDRVTQLIADQSQGIDITDEEYHDTLMAILENAPKHSVVTRMAGWNLEPTHKRMARVGEQARSLAQRLGKGNIQVNYEGGELLTDPKHWSEFWSSFVHVVRNAVDHGLESPEDRSAGGKPEHGKLTFSTRVHEGQFIVELNDDGSGINWSRVAEVAQQHDLPHKTHEDLVAAMFSNNFSTAEYVTATSGRGVGLAAVSEACQALNGTIHVDSKPNVGTKFTFSFPVSQMAPRTLSLLDDFGIEGSKRAILGDHACTA